MKQKDSWESKAERAYANDSEEKRKKAMDAGRAMDNALILEYSVGGERGHGAGTTKQHFMTSNWIKYFSYEALGFERLKLMWK